MKASTEHVGSLRDGSELVRIVCALEPQSGGKLPEWVHLLPAGPEAEARDGRRFALASAEQVARASELPLLVDWEHKSESSDTRAAGWIEALESRPTGARAGLWGRVAWTPQGEQDVRARHYRYLSPVVIGRRAHSGGAHLFHVERLASVALTNRPALRLEALESLRAQLSEQLTSPDVPSLDGVNREALRALGLTDRQIAESARELFTPPPRRDIDRAALRAFGLTEEQIDESERELEGVL